MYKVYKQVKPLCWPFAFLSALNNLGINLDETWANSFAKTFASTDHWIRVCVEQWLIKWWKDLLTIKQIDYWLAKWSYVITATNFMNHEWVRNPPYIHKFDWNGRHFFCLVEDLWDRWRVLDSWGEDFADKWTWYVMKKDFVKLMYPVRIYK